MWPPVAAPLLTAAGALLGSATLLRAGTLLSAGTATCLADIAAHDVVPGANDNGTGVIALLAIARAFSEDPPENLRLIFLSTSEEATCDGIAAFAERHFGELPGDSTFFLCLECLGSPQLAVLYGEGMLRISDYPRRSVELVEGIGEELGISLKPNLRTRNATDAVQPLAAGYQCACLVSVTDLHQIANYHWPTDVPENVDYGTLDDAIRLSEATIRRLDESWL
jgi:Zn-dependent M28 family amino/carboxypeptidase